MMATTQKNIGHFIQNKQMVYDTNQNLIVPESTGDPNRPLNLVDLKVLKKSGMYSTTNKQVAQKFQDQQNMSDGFAVSNKTTARDGGAGPQHQVNVNIKSGLHETNASIGTLYDGINKTRKVDEDPGDSIGDMDLAPKRRPVPGASKLKIADVRNLSDDADQIIDSLKAINNENK